MQDSLSTASMEVHQDLVKFAFVSSWTFQLFVYQPSGFEFLGRLLRVVGVYNNLLVVPNISEVNMFAFGSSFGVTITARWTDLTRPLNTEGCFHKWGQFVKNTSNILGPRVDFLTSCSRLCWLQRSCILSWLMTPIIT